MKRRWMGFVLAAAGAACVGPAMFAQVAENLAANDEFSSDARDGGRGGDGGGRGEFDTRFDGGRGGVMVGVDERWNSSALSPVERDEDGEKLAQLNGTLAGEIQQLAQKLRVADFEDVAEGTEKALYEKVGQQFDVRQQMRERQLAALEEQVKRLRNVHNERADQRDRIVRDCVQQLIREAQGLGWGDAGEGGQFKMSWSADAAPEFLQHKILTKQPAKMIYDTRWDDPPAAK